MMLLALVAPELIMGFAARQYIVARWFSRVYPGLSRTHGFFFAMGGFVTRDGHHPIVTEKQLAQYIEGIKEITEEDIVDKSKGDNLSKAWTFVQVGWFSAKYFARLKEHLPILALETATLGFAVIYGCTWWFWRKKPQDVSEAIRIDLVFPAPALSSDLTHHIQVEDDPPKQNSDAVLVNNTRVKPLDDSLAEKWPTATETFHRHFVVRVGHRLNAIVFGKYENFDPMASDSVPSFWAIPVGEEPTNLPSVLGCQILCASLFGGVHCCAWNARFPSIIEMWMWRGSAALITGFPLLCFLLLGISNTLDHGSIRRGVLTYTNYGLITLYIVARVALLILPFTTLRISSPGTLVDADWTTIF
ncbi:hypothetical protein B0H14DRAFT_2616046 [Mycena olivaceomarginata]|nr:hypothetical protein B0H14DRAFT_2616046 [Mycena olivaceomarginata]